MEGLTVEVGEEEGPVGAEEAGRGDEGLAVVVPQVCPVTEVGPRELFLSGFGGGRLAGGVEILRQQRRVKWGADIVEERRNIQLLAPDQMLVIVHKVVSPLAQRPHIQSRVLARYGRRVHPNGPREGLRRELVDAVTPRSRSVDGGSGGEGSFRGGLRPIGSGIGRWGRRFGFWERAPRRGYKGAAPLAEETRNGSPRGCE